MNTSMSVLFLKYILLTFKNNYKYVNTFDQFSCFRAIQTLKQQK
jgi:hypothetical protein